MLIRCGIVLVLLICDLFLSRAGSHLIAGWCFALAVLITLLVLFKLLDRPIRRFLGVPVDARFLPATRMIYALMCLYTGIQHLWAVGHGMEPSNFVLLGWPESKLLA
ncbi:MAG: hypothetical protein WAU70_13705 [Flavobacteriales bacterium]